MIGSNSGSQHNSDNPNINRPAVSTGNRSASPFDPGSICSAANTLILIIPTHV